MFLQKFLANIVDSLQIDILTVDLTKSNTISTPFSTLKQSIDVSESVAFDNLLDGDLLDRVIDLNGIEVLQGMVVLRTITVTLYTRDHHLIEEPVLLHDLESYVARGDETYLPRSSQ